MQRRCRRKVLEQSENLPELNSTSVASRRFPTTRARKQRLLVEVLLLLGLAGLFASGPAHQVLASHIVIGSSSASSTTTSQGRVWTIRTSVQNTGGTPESFDVTVYWDNLPVDAQRVGNLEEGNSVTLSFSWTVTQGPPADHAIKIVAGDAALVIQAERRPPLPIQSPVWEQFWYVFAGGGLTLLAVVVLIKRRRISSHRAQP